MRKGAKDKKRERRAGKTKIRRCNINYRKRRDRQKSDQTVGMKKISRESRSNREEENVRQDTGNGKR